MNEFVKARDEILGLLKKDLIGPFEENEIIPDPVGTYMSGILYPQKLILENETNSDLRDGEDDLSGLASEIANLDSSVTQRNQFSPASMGLSFYLNSSLPALNVKLKLAKYIRNGSKQNYSRKPIEENLTLSPSNANKFFKELDCSLSSVWRKKKDDFWLVTVSLINNKIYDHERIYPESEDCLFQCKVIVYPTNEGMINKYPHYGFYSPDEEKQILELLYRRKNIYAVGHGCSVNWELYNENVKYVETEFTPSVIVPKMDFNLDPKYNSPDSTQALSLRFLKTITENKDSVIKSLTAFSNAYHQWIEEIKNEDVPAVLDILKQQQVENCNKTLSNISEGILILKNNNNAATVFGWMNEVMLRQMDHNYNISQLSNSSIYYDSDYDNYEAKQFDRKWRPFQLAFLLLSLRSIVDPDTDRDFLDLIWFPTGGGKTEAYLGLTAFTIFYLRLKFRDKASGTNVFMRYTLKALTTQQFIRAASLICAMELKRQEFPELLGEKSIKLGLFVGKDESPISFSEARLQAEEMVRERRNTTQILNCPWCNHPIMVVDESEVTFGLKYTDKEHTFHCLNINCDFNVQLPLQIVDEGLFSHPPSFVIGTVDKFARLAWVPEMYSLFGFKTKTSANEYEAPALIIQDELHLISGPLGSIAGLYEAAIDFVCSQKGYKPKIIASSATVRNAAEQVSNIFDRKLRIFPPSALDIDDSFFARADYTNPGRLYVGVLNPGKSGVYSAVRVYSVLLQAANEISSSIDSVKDNYFTVVGYFNSLRELGKTNTLAFDDIPKRIKIISGKTGGEPRGDIKVEEMRSNPEKSLAELLESLNKTYTSKDAVDLLLATNMISVGIDINRLGLMIVNGQPKTIAEYIQASSRVGRTNPGLVITLFSPSKIRDRSHYEKFPSFHMSLYKDVEPSSVTPYSPQVIERALQAVLIMSLRSFENLRDKKKAINFGIAQPEYISFRQFIEKRTEGLKSSVKEKILDYLDILANEWEIKTQASKEKGIDLFYDFNSNRTANRLIKSAGDNGTGWEIMHNMRSVEGEALLTQRNYNQGE